MTIRRSVMRPHTPITIMPVTTRSVRESVRPSTITDPRPVGTPVISPTTIRIRAKPWAMRNPLVRGGIPISGIFDLEPIALCVLNDKLSLDADEIAALSPLKRLADRAPPLRLWVGAAELPELKRQSEVYARAARARGLPCSLTVLRGHHHFSILDELSDPNGALTRALVELITISAS